MSRNVCLIIFDVIFYAIEIIFAPVLLACVRLFEKSVDWLLKHRKRLEKYLAITLALRALMYAFISRCFVRFHRLLMRFCQRRVRDCESHAMQTGLGGCNSSQLLTSS